jgi:hypothetical protein
VLYHERRPHRRPLAIAGGVTGALVVLPPPWLPPWGCTPAPFRQASPPKCLTHLPLAIRTAAAAAASCAGLRGPRPRRWLRHVAVRLAARTPKAPCGWELRSLLGARAAAPPPPPSPPTPPACPAPPPRPSSSECPAGCLNAMPAVGSCAPPPSPLPRPRRPLRPRLPSPAPPPSSECPAPVILLARFWTAFQGAFLFLAASTGREKTW